MFPTKLRFSHKVLSKGKFGEGGGGVCCVISVMDQLSSMHLSSASSSSSILKKDFFKKGNHPHQELLWRFPELLKTFPSQQTKLPASKTASDAHLPHVSVSEALDGSYTNAL